MLRSQCSVSASTFAALAAAVCFLCLPAEAGEPFPCEEPEFFRDWVRPPAFVGEVVWVDRDPVTRDRTAFLLAEEAWGTEIVNPVVVLAPSEGNHDVSLTVGERYLVYDRADSEKGLVLTHCGLSGGVDWEVKREERALLGPPTVRMEVTPELRAAFLEEIRGEVLRSKAYCDDQSPASYLFHLPLDRVETWPLDWKAVDGRSLLRGGVVSLVASPWNGAKGVNGGPPPNKTWLFFQGKVETGCWVEACVSATTSAGPLKVNSNLTYEPDSTETRVCMWRGPELHSARLPISGINPATPPGGVKVLIELRAAPLPPDDAPGPGIPYSP